MWRNQQKSNLLLKRNPQRRASPTRKRVMVVDLIKDFSPLGSDLMRKYITELPEAQDNLQRLNTFVFRWGEVWTRQFIGKSEGFTVPDVTGQTIECIQLNRESLCPHMSMKHKRRCDGMRILLTELFVVTVQIDKEFRLPHYLSISRLGTGQGLGKPILQ